MKTYNIFEDVDLVEEHALLIVVHVTLTEHLNCALGTSLPVHAHSHFSKGTCTLMRKRRSKSKLEGTHAQTQKTVRFNKLTSARRLGDECVGVLRFAAEDRSLTGSQHLANSVKVSQFTLGSSDKVRSSEALMLRVLDLDCLS